jgi:O-antigen ligase
MAGLFLAARAVYGKGKRPWIWWAASAAACIGLAASMARTYFVAVFPSVAVLLWKRGKRLVFAAIIVLLLGGAVFAFWGPRGIKMRLQATVNFHNPSIAQRLYLWQSGWSMFTTHPLFGWGPGTYPAASTPYKKPFEKRLSPRYRVPFMTLKHAHNLYLMMAIQSGFPGLLLFLLFIVSVLDAIRRNPDPVVRWGVLAALTAFLFGGLFEYNGGDAEVATFIFFLMGLAASYAPSKPAENSG